MRWVLESRAANTGEMLPTDARSAPIDLRTYRGGTNSQYGEAGIIDRILEEIGVRARVCVDVGAFDLDHISNVSHLWRLHGWRAILIEANPLSYDRMLRQRPSGVDLTILNETI